MLIKIFTHQCDGFPSQHFIRTSGNAGIGRNIKISQTIRDHHASTVGITEKSQLILKLIKARTWHEYFKVFWGHSRTHTEFKGSKLLSSVGIDAPEVYEMGISLPVRRGEKYIGYYLMENIEESGYFALSSTQNDLSGAQISMLTSELAKVMKTLNDHKIVYSDLNFDNIYCEPTTMSIKLIDTGAKLYHRRKKHNAKFRKALKNLTKSIKKSSLKGTELDSHFKGELIKSKNTERK